MPASRALLVGSAVTAADVSPLGPHLNTRHTSLLLLLLAAGAAMVYLYELAHSKHKGVTGSVGYISLGSGVVLGILVVNAVISLVPSGE
jgi:hypothetical protein